MKDQYELESEEDTQESNSTSNHKMNFKKEAYEWAESIAVSLAIVLFVFTFLIRVAEVKGSSMENTLLSGERLVISNLFYTPQDGDIVVATRPNDEPIIKRVIATQGQVVDIDFTTGTVTVDGNVLSEPYIKNETTLQYDVTFPQTVPQGCVFLMGDNRQNSLDSRSTEIGMVEEERIMGRLILRLKFPIQKVDEVS